MVASAAPSRGTIVPSTEAPGDASASNTPASIGADAVERGRDIRQQDDRIVVLLVDVHPRERARRARRPLRQQRRLPPARAGGQEHDRNRCCALLEHARSALARDTAPPRPCGGSSFDSSSSNAGAGRSWSPRLRAPARTSQTGSPRVQPTIEDELTRRPPGGLDGRSLTATILVPCPPETRAALTLSDACPRLSRGADTTTTARAAESCHQGDERRGPAA